MFFVRLFVNSDYFNVSTLHANFTTMLKARNPYEARAVQTLRKNDPGTHPMMTDLCPVRSRDKMRAVISLRVDHSSEVADT